MKNAEIFLNMTRLQTFDPQLGHLYPFLSLQWLNDQQETLLGFNVNK